MPKFCAGHNSHTVWDNLIIFGRDIYQVKKVCSMQEGQLLLCWFFYPNKHKASSFTLIYKAFIFYYYFWICTLTNSKYLQILCILYKLSDQKELLDDFDKNKKNNTEK